MGVTDEAQMEKMIAATKQVTLTNNGDGTWTQVSGLKTSTFPIDKEYTVRRLWDDILQNTVHSSWQFPLIH